MVVVVVVVIMLIISAAAASRPIWTRWVRGAPSGAVGCCEGGGGGGGEGRLGMVSVTRCAAAAAAPVEGESGASYLVQSTARRSGVSRLEDGINPPRSRAGRTVSGQNVRLGCVDLVSKKQNTAYRSVCSDAAAAGVFFFSSSFSLLLLLLLLLPVTECRVGLHFYETSIEKVLCCVWRYRYAQSIPPVVLFRVF